MRIAAARREDPEFELLDTGIFNGGRYFDITMEYAKASPNDILIRLRIDNRGPEASTLHLLPTVWFRNAWSWGRTGEGYWPKPSISQTDASASRMRTNESGEIQIRSHYGTRSVSLHRERDEHGVAVPGAK